MMIKIIFAFILFCNTVGLAQDNLPPHFEGDSIQTIVGLANEAKLFYETNQILTKDEFETTAQYKERLSQFEKERTEKEEKFRKNLIVVLNYQYFSYNADKNKLNIQTAFTKKNNLEYSAIIESKSHSETYTGTNVFGVQAKVTKITNQSYQLFFVATEETSPVISVDLDMKAEKAKELKPYLRTVIYFELNYPFIEGRVTSSKPTIQSPYETSSLDSKLFAKAKKILFINQKTGEVLAIKELI